MPRESAWTCKLTQDDDLGLVLSLTETVGVRQPRKIKTYYRVEINPATALAYRLHKLVQGDEEPTLYDVCLSGTYPTCDCTGFLQHGHCKHVRSLSALLAAGRLNQPQPTAE